MASEAVGQPRGSAQATQTIELPAPTAWPIILAFGITLVFAGLVTDDSVSILGAIFAIAGCIGWFRDVLPHEKHESVPVEENVPTIATSRPRVTRIEWITQELHRARLPLEIYPISAGVKGGMAGSAAMAVLAILYGIVSGRGIWYPINLLSTGLFPDRSTTAQIAVFHWDALIIATIIHLVCSLLVGLLYGAALPMFPRRPILLGGVIAPILWTGLIHSILEALNPVLNQRIDWLWFVVSQIGFGVVAGIVVSKQERIRTWQYLPFAVRAGIEAPGAIDEKSGENHLQ
ncbi:MAG TPA: hypothetical protein VN901_08760 [Candidatus Acidoferrales bacterium]|nr:hypothetical protein [Candidatus Acidoferrales bacterium]